MNPEHLKYLVCPESGSDLTLTDAKYDGSAIKTGTLVAKNGESYPVIDFIPRFVSSNNYAQNFGFEWNLHNRTQHDDYSKCSASRDRFLKETQWGQNLTGRLMLEAGCGSGRFTGIAADSGATLISFDYSDAVTACYASHGKRANVLIVQADIYNMPFRKNWFDYVFCLGVLQHTPNPKASFLNLASHLKPGGRLSTDCYIKDMLHCYLHTKYYVRPFVKRISSERLYAIVSHYIDLLWPFIKIIRRVPFRIGQGICVRLLVADYASAFPGMDDKILKQWAYLDSFDMLSPAYDLPQTVKTFRKWHDEAGLTQVDVRKGYNGIEGRGLKP